MKLRWLAIAALVAPGCTFGIALCNEDKDCGTGGTCDPAAGVCLSLPATNGGTGGGSADPDGGPGSTTLAILLPAAAARTAAAGAMLDDPPTSFLRSEQPFVWLQVSRALNNPSLKVAGVDAVAIGGGACTQPCTGQCYCFAVDLAQPALNGLRGSFVLNATGVDPGGKTVNASTSLNVTRVGWRRPLGQAVRSTPAIGANGTVFVGTAAGVVAIGPGGDEKWNKALGRVDSSVMIGPSGPAPQRIFAGAFGATPTLTALDATGALVGQCNLPKDSEPEAAPAAISDGAAFYLNRTRALIAFRPTFATACETRSAGEDISYPGSLVAGGTSVFMVDERPMVRRFDLGSTWAEFTMSQWPGQLSGSYRNRGLAMSGGKLFGSGDVNPGGTVFQASVTGGLKFDYGFMPPRLSTTARAPVVAKDGLVLVGVPAGLAAVSMQAAQVGAGDRIVNTPALGEGGRLYALAENGGIAEWTYAGGKPVRTWTDTVEKTMAPVFEASPALDCARTSAGALIPGRPGVLYAAARGGTLYSIIVDAHGIDTTAQWPKYQKDPRNSGSADTGLQEFACP